MTHKSTQINRRRGHTADLVVLLAMGVLAWSLVAMGMAGMLTAAMQADSDAGQHTHTPHPHPHHHTEIEE